MRVWLETQTVQTIPALTLAPDAARQCPVVFFIPGFGSNKETGLSIGYPLALHGYFFVAFDPWLHGERYDRRLDHAADPALGGIYPADTGLDTGALFYRVIQQCLFDVQTLMAHFSAEGRADVARCGVTGPSMGGYASFLIFARIPQMLAAVPMIGLPSFSRRWLDVLDESAFSNPAWAGALQAVAEQTRRHTAFVREIDPSEALRHAAPRALLVMNCDFDTDQPKQYSLDAYRELLPYYAAAPDRLRLRIYPAGHTVTREMERDAVEWFRRHLPADA